MDQRKSLHSKLSQNEAALLEWESVASWLASDSLVNALQTTLAKEVEIYLEWSTYICLNVFSAPQTAKYLLLAPLRDLLQVCCFLKKQFAILHHICLCIATSDHEIYTFVCKHIPLSCRFHISNKRACCAESLLRLATERLLPTRCFFVHEQYHHCILCQLLLNFCHAVFFTASDSENWRLNSASIRRHFDNAGLFINPPR